MTEPTTGRYYPDMPPMLDGENGEAMCSEVQSTTDPNDPLFLHGVGTAVTVTPASRNLSITASR